MGGSPGDVSENPVTLEKREKGWRMTCDVGEATKGLENELWRRWSDGKLGEWAELLVIVVAELILQAFSHFTYVTAHSPTLPSLYLRHSSFSNPSFASPTSQALHLRHLASRPWMKLFSNFAELDTTTTTSERLCTVIILCVIFSTLPPSRIPAVLCIVAGNPKAVGLFA